MPCLSHRHLQPQHRRQLQRFLRCLSSGQLQRLRGSAFLHRLPCRHLQPQHRQQLQRFLPCLPSGQLQRLDGASILHNLPCRHLQSQYPRQFQRLLHFMSCRLLQFPKRQHFEQRLCLLPSRVLQSSGGICILYPVFGGPVLQSGFIRLQRMSFGNVCPICWESRLHSLRCRAIQ